MDHLFFIGLIVFIFLLSSVIGNSAKLEIERSIRGKRCPPHKWEWRKQPDDINETEYMICAECGKFPGRDVRS